jgi:hypothetical protein
VVSNVARRIWSRIVTVVTATVIAGTVMTGPASAATLAETDLSLSVISIFRVPEGDGEKITISVRLRNEGPLPLTEAFKIRVVTATPRMFQSIPSGAGCRTEPEGGNVVCDHSHQEGTITNVNGALNETFVLHAPTECAALCHVGIHIQNRFGSSSPLLDLNRGNNDVILEGIW